MNTIDSAKIVGTFKAARFMKWGAVPLALLSIIASAIIGVEIHPSMGVLTLALFWGLLFIYGYQCTRCPSCGQAWWSWLMVITLCPSLGELEMPDEVDSMKCRKCGLEIGPHLRGL